MKLTQEDIRKYGLVEEQMEFQKNPSPHYLFLVNARDGWDEKPQFSKMFKSLEKAKKFAEQVRPQFNFVEILNFKLESLSHLFDRNKKD